MFWSYKTLEQNLDTLIFDTFGKPSGKIENIDCNAYTLTIGPEVFVTPSDPRTTNQRGHIKISLEENGQFVIPKGQFAFLITEEVVAVPEKAMAFISFKATYKFQGLINVSGFHVDPGYKGRLIFSLFNAGPKDITLQRGQKFALIWYANLDQQHQPPSGKKAGSEIQNLGLNSKLISPMNDEVFSPAVVQKRITDLSDRVKDVEVRINVAMLAVIIAVLLAFVGDIFKDNIKTWYQSTAQQQETKIQKTQAITLPPPQPTSKPK